MVPSVNMSAKMSGNSLGNIPRGVVLRRIRHLMLLLSALAAVLLTAPAFAAAAQSESADPVRDADDRWGIVRQQLFADRPIAEDSSVLSLSAPARAFDAARVPVTIRALINQNPERFIEKLFLVVDKNPVPVASTFTFEPNRGWQTLDTELRVNEYSMMRIIAQLNDGSLHMDSSFIKAVGGCSAPPTSYDRSDVTKFGSFEASIKNLLDPKVPAQARIRINHPNASGMQFDQMTRTYIPAHYIHTMGAEFNGDPLFTVETNFSFSQDPVLGFNFEPDVDGKLMMYALDSKNNRFEESWEIEAVTSN